MLPKFRAIRPIVIHKSINFRPSELSICSAIANLNSFGKPMPLELSARDDVFKLWSRRRGEKQCKGSGLTPHKYFSDRIPSRLENSNASQLSDCIYYILLMDQRQNKNCASTASIFFSLDAIPVPFAFVLYTSSRSKLTAKQRRCGLQFTLIMFRSELPWSFVA